MGLVGVSRYLLSNSSSSRSSGSGSSSPNPRYDRRDVERNRQRKTDCKGVSYPLASSKRTSYRCSTSGSLPYSDPSQWSLGLISGSSGRGPRTEEGVRRDGARRIFKPLRRGAVRPLCSSRTARIIGFGRRRLPGPGKTNLEECPSHRGEDRDLREDSEDQNPRGLD